jgi:hypothetical protein
MEEIEALINKDNLTDEELDFLIAKIKQDYWPELKDKEIPKNCGLCDLFKICRVVNPKLICPWLV